MHDSVQRLNLIKNKIKEVIDQKQLKTSPQIIAVTKTFKLESIVPLLEDGHKHFGENKIQETESKWLIARKKYSNLQIHMIGKLQSNKAKKAVLLYDFIHSLDSDKLAKKLSFYQIELNKKIKFFIQVNLGDEEQKAGILLKNLNTFYNYCTQELFLNVIGLMCLPPVNSDSTKYFKVLKSASDKLNLKHLSMGMSHDYKEATLNQSTFLRLGTAILGKRKVN
jgi:pyridoxal phosphate enzyme (YggS family)